MCACRKRSANDRAIQHGPQLRKTSRDDEFFIDATSVGFSEDHLRVRGNSDSNDNRSAIEDAVLNLVADDNSDLIKKQSIMRWDKKKKKYVESNSLNTDRKVRNEAGVIVKDKDQGKPTFYQNWVKKTNQRIPKAGSAEIADDTVSEVSSSVANFVVGGKQVGKRKGRGGRLYAPGTDS